MDLWIRTQDKRQLLKVNDGLYIANGFTDTDDTFIGITNVGHVGRYAEEERALEVLDEIQSILNTYNRVNGTTGNYEDLDLAIKVNMLNYVYEMPQE